MKIPNFPFTNLPTLLAFSSLIAFFGSTLAAPGPLNPSNPGLRPRPGQQCTRKNPCDGWVGKADVAFYDSAPEKQRKVENQMKRHMDADPPDLKEDCASEICNMVTERCVQMHGHENEPNQNDDKWRTCCDKTIPLAGKSGKCCHDVGNDGVCIV